MTEEPEQVLEQDGATALVIHWRTRFDDRRHEEARAEQRVEHHHDRRHKKCWEREESKNCSDEDAPHSERQTHECHAARAVLQDCSDVVQTTHGERHNEHGK